jgi:hypothetical protein
MLLLWLIAKTVGDVPTNHFGQVHAANKHALHAAHLQATLFCSPFYTVKLEEMESQLSM